MWMMILTGNVDGDAHRDLLAAAAGSAAMLHTRRAISVVAASIAVGIIVSAVTVSVTASDSPVRDLLICTIVTIGGGLLGVSFGTTLHRPLLRHSGLVVLLAVMLALVTIVSPIPVRVLDKSSTGDLVPAALMMVIAGCWCAVLVTASSRFAASRAR